MAKVDGVNSIPFWGTPAIAANLPNVAGSPTQTIALEVGDQAYVTSDAALYVCSVATPGAAVWTKVSTALGPVIAKWNELDTTQFTVLRDAGDAVTLSRVAGTRAAYLRLQVVAAGDDVIVIGFSGATIPSIDASRNTRCVFMMDIMQTPSGDLFNAATGGNAQFGTGIYTGAAGATLFATIPMFYGNISNVQGHRITAGVLADAGGTPSDFSVGNFGTLFNSTQVGRIYHHEASWLINQPAGSHVAFETIYTGGPRTSSPFNGSFPYDDTGDSTVGGTNTAAWAASWNDVVMTHPCFGIRTGRAGTFQIDFANILLARPLMSQ